MRRVCQVIAVVSLESELAVTGPVWFAVGLHVFTDHVSGPDARSRTDPFGSAWASPVPDGVSLTHSAWDSTVYAVGEVRYRAASWATLALGISYRGRRFYRDAQPLFSSLDPDARVSTIRALGEADARLFLALRFEASTDRFR